MRFEDPFGAVLRSKKPFQPEAFRKAMSQRVNHQLPAALSGACSSLPACQCKRGPGIWRIGEQGRYVSGDRRRALKGFEAHVVVRASHLGFCFLKRRVGFRSGDKDAKAGEASKWLEIRSKMLSLQTSGRIRKSQKLWTLFPEEC